MIRVRVVVSMICDVDDEREASVERKGACLVCGWLMDNGTGLFHLPVFLLPALFIICYSISV